MVTSLPDESGDLTFPRPGALPQNENGPRLRFHRGSIHASDVTLILPQKEKGLVVLGQCWYFSNGILRLTPKNDCFQAKPGPGAGTFLSS